MTALQMGRGKLSGLPDRTAHRMMMTWGSGMLLRALRGEPELVVELVAPNLPKVTTPRDRTQRPEAIEPDPASRAVIAATALRFGLSYDEIVGHDKFKALVMARFVVFRLLDEQGHSAAHIGRMMGGRDHSTILNGLTKFESYAALYPFMREAYERLREDLRL